MRAKIQLELNEEERKIIEDIQRYEKRIEEILNKRTLGNILSEEYENKILYTKGFENEYLEVRVANKRITFTDKENNNKNYIVLSRTIDVGSLFANLFRSIDDRHIDDNIIDREVTVSEVIYKHIKNNNILEAELKINNTLSIQNLKAIRLRKMFQKEMLEYLMNIESFRRIVYKSKICVL